MFCISGNVSKNCSRAPPKGRRVRPRRIRGESLDEGELENWGHEMLNQPMINRGTEQQTSFFAHEVFEYFLPAQSRHYDGTPSRRERRGQAKQRDLHLNERRPWRRIETVKPKTATYAEYQRSLIRTNPKSGCLDLRGFWGHLQVSDLQTQHCNPEYPSSEIGLNKYCWRACPEVVDIVED